MPKIFIFFIIFIYFYSAHLHGQSANIIVQQGSNSWIYPDINTAISQAPSGAYIYLPGGAVPYTSNSNSNNFPDSLIIDKELHIIGAGIFPDSTLATNYSNLGIGEIYLKGGSSNSSFEGFSIRKIVNIAFGTTISNIVIKRIRAFETITFGSNTSANNLLICNCILNMGLNIQNTNNVIVSNNIIMDRFDFYNGIYPHNANVLNNIFLEGSPLIPYAFQFYDFVNLKNNIFLTNSSSISIGYCNLRNNFLPNGVTFYYSTYSGNYIGGSPQSILLSYVPPFSYYNNYHIINGSIGDNGGDDGTDIGIYGGLYPWKEGMVPTNPHIQVFSISPSILNTNIHINIKVDPQNN